MTIVNASAIAVASLLALSAFAADQKFAQSRNGMAATTTPSATRAAARVLAEGGNAIDAAAAAHFALMVTDPANASLGGRTQILVRLKNGMLFEIDGATEAPAAVGGSKSKPESERQAYAVAPIPGNLAALDLLIAKHGKLKLADALAPAIELAEQGFQITPGLARTWGATAQQLLKNPGAASNFLDGGTAAYVEGTRFRQPKLAETLREVARGGASAFYAGPIARSIVRDMRSAGGYIEMGDLERYRALAGPVARTTYRGYEVASAGGRAWGDTLVEMLNIAGRFSFSREQSSTDLDVMARIMSAALDDRPQELNTLKPKTNGLSLDLISSAAHGDKRARGIRVSLKGKPAPSTEQTRVALHDTTHLAVMDSEGNTVSQTTSIGPSFGSRVATADLGFLYAHSYRMKADPAAGARDETEMTPTILFRNGKPFLAIGAAGSERIPTAILQVIVNLVDRGMTLDQAVAAPRIFSIGDRLLMSAGFPPPLIEEIRKRGFHVEVGGQDFRQHLGIVQAVMYDAKSRLFAGMADPAYDGIASGPSRR